MFLFSSSFLGFVLPLLAFTFLRPRRVLEDCAEEKTPTPQQPCIVVSLFARRVSDILDVQSAFYERYGPAKCVRLKVCTGDDGDGERYTSDYEENATLRARKAYDEFPVAHVALGIDTGVFCALTHRGAEESTRFFQTQATRSGVNEYAFRHALAEWLVEK